MVIIGVIVLVAAVVVGVAAATSDGAALDVPGVIRVFGYDLHGSIGSVFLYGIAVGAVAMLGLALIAAGSGRLRRRGRASATDR